jgi:hypothetical protein
MGFYFVLDCRFRGNDSKEARQGERRGLDSCLRRNDT